MAERLDRLARRLGNGVSRTRISLLLLEESLRESEFALIEYRDSAVGRQPYMKNSNLSVWEVIMVAKDHDLDVVKTAEYFQRPTDWVQAALNYYAAYRSEIDQAINDNHSSFESIRKLAPGLQSFSAPASGDY
jgi:uncharacterized protein (DUF433 family)